MKTKWKWNHNILYKDCRIRVSIVKFVNIKINKPSKLIIKEKVHDLFVSSTRRKEASGAESLGLYWHVHSYSDYKNGASSDRQWREIFLIFEMVWWFKWPPTCSEHETSSNRWLAKYQFPKMVIKIIYPATLLPIRVPAQWRFRPLHTRGIWTRNLRWRWGWSLLPV